MIVSVFTCFVNLLLRFSFCVLTTQSNVTSFLSRVVSIGVHSFVISFLNVLKLLTYSVICLLISLLGRILLWSIPWNLRISRRFVMPDPCWFGASLFKQLKSLLVFLWILKRGVNKRPCLILLRLLSHVLRIFQTVFWNMFLCAIEWMAWSSMTCCFNREFLAKLLIWNL